MRTPRLLRAAVLLPLAASVARELAEVRARRGLVLVDQRGTGPRRAAVPPP
jgi:hypothetical protein